MVEDVEVGGFKRRDLSVDAEAIVENSYEQARPESLDIHIS